MDHRLYNLFDGGPKSVACTVPPQDDIRLRDLFRQKWEEQKSNAETLKFYCKTFDKGGILLLKYTPGNNNPEFCFVENNTDSDVWLQLIRSIVDFHELYINYDPEKHYFICMIIQEQPNGKSYHQLVRLNY